MTARSKVWVCGRSPTETVGSNPIWGDVCLSVLNVCCQVEVCATRWSLVQKSRTNCGGSLCLIQIPCEWGGLGPLGGGGGCRAKIKKENTGNAFLRNVRSIKKAVEFVCDKTGKCHCMTQRPVPAAEVALCAVIRTWYNYRRFSCLLVLLFCSSAFCCPSLLLS